MNFTNNNPSRLDIQSFVAKNFALADEIEVATPVDWKERPSILKEIHDPKYREWALKLNDLWRTLIRRAKQDVELNPSRYSFIYVPNPFVIPGGRFRGEPAIKLRTKISIEN